MKIDLSRFSAAEILLWQYGVTSPEHIDLTAIAQERGAQVRYRSLHGCEARLIAYGDKAIISINTASSPGRQRFSLGHELAHWIRDAAGKTFLCGKDDISPQGAEGRSIEATANNYASQLVLPDYLVRPWIGRKPTSLDTTCELACDFHVSRTAAAIKLVRNTSGPSALVFHSATERFWFSRACAFPTEFFLSNELHPETVAFEMVYGSVTGMPRKRQEPAARWMSGGGAYRYRVESQSLQLGSRSALTLLTVLS